MAKDSIKKTPPSTPPTMAPVLELLGLVVGRSEWEESSEMVKVWAGLEEAYETVKVCAGPDESYETIKVWVGLEGLASEEGVELDSDVLEVSSAKIG